MRRTRFRARGRKARQAKFAKMRMAPPRVVRLRTTGIVPPVKYINMEYRCSWSGIRPAIDGPLCQQMGNGFKANSVYDPNLDLAGPFNVSSTLYNFYSEFYNKYEVLRSKMVITLRQAESAFGAAPGTFIAQPLLKWGVLLDDDGVPHGLDGSHSWVTPIQRPTTKTRSFQPDGNGAHYQTIKMYWSKKANGNDQTNESAFGSNPSNLAFWYPWYAYATPGVQENQFPKLQYEVYIRYYVKLSDCKDLEESNHPMQQPDGI